jgi:hypothetical protein
MWYSNFNPYNVELFPCPKNKKSRTQLLNSGIYSITGINYLSYLNWYQFSKSNFLHSTKPIISQYSSYCQIQFTKFISPQIKKSHCNNTNIIKLLEMHMISKSIIVCHWECPYISYHLVTS